MDAALVAHQCELESLFNKNQLIPRIRKEFEDLPLFKQFFKENKIPEKFGFDLMAQMALHKRADLPTMVGVMRHHCNTDQEVVDLLLKAATVDLIDWNDVLKIFVVKFTITQDVQDEIDKFQYPLPMVVEPLTIKTNRDVGYYLTGGSIILKKNHHEDDVCLDHINRVNQVKYCINHDTATMVKNEWRNLDKPKEGETREEFEKRVRQFDKYDRTAKDVMAILLKHGNEFYMTHKYDKRGRIYCQGHHVNYQGTPWNKAVIEFADKEVVE